MLFEGVFCFSFMVIAILKLTDEDNRTKFVFRLTVPKKAR